MFGTDGSWFANNVDYERNVPTTVTITETEAPVGCKMSTTPWVFTWSYNDVQLMNYYHMSGSWDTKDGTNVFNLYNDCDKPGQGEYTPDPVTPVVPVEVETLADTGESENTILAVAAGMLLASVGLALSPRLYRGEA
jgi:LPXTG-motif cell wall-anchored protein